METFENRRGRAKRNINVYDNTAATILGHIFECYSNTGKEPARTIHLAQQLSLNKYLKKFGKNGRNAACKELHQIHNRIAFKPIGTKVKLYKNVKMIWKV